MAPSPSLPPFLSSATAAVGVSQVGVRIKHKQTSQAASGRAARRPKHDKPVEGARDQRQGAPRPLRSAVCMLVVVAAVEERRVFSTSERSLMRGAEGGGAVAADGGRRPSLSLSDGGQGGRGQARQAGGRAGRQEGRAGHSSYFAHVPSLCRRGVSELDFQRRGEEEDRRMGTEWGRGNLRRMPVAAATTAAVKSRLGRQASRERDTLRAPKQSPAREIEGVIRGHT